MLTQLRPGLFLACVYVLCLGWAVNLSADDAAASALPDALDLAGAWRFRLDDQDTGIQQRWFETELAEPITLPGSLQEQGFGHDVHVDTAWTGDIVDRSWFTDPRYEPYRQAGNVKVVFWLQPNKHYVGPAWYQRSFTVPEDFAKHHVVLRLERPHWTTRVWVDQRDCGQATSLSTAHEFDLTGITPGTHRLTIRVDNRMHVDVGVNSHSVSDHTQSNWNGVAGEILLEARPVTVRIDDVQVYPDVTRKSIRVAVAYTNDTDNRCAARLRLSAACGSHQPPQLDLDVTLDVQGGELTADLPLGEAALLWDEFSPNIYQLRVTLASDGQCDQRELTFGLREISTVGTQFTLNGRPLFLRGTLDCCIFPRTGYPPTDRPAWQRIFRILKAHGLNHMRFHSWCPPEAAFIAADQAGVFLQVECASWANQGATIGDGRPLDSWLREEADRILRCYGNHPSFTMLAYGNEPAGARYKEFLGQLVNQWRDRDSRRVYTSAAGWPIIPANQYHNTPAPRIHQWGQALNDRLNGQPPATVADYREFIDQYDVPVLSHEIGQWCVYPNFAEIAKYTGVLKPRNFEVFRDQLAAAGMEHLAPDFLMASGKLQTLCYKEEIESALRTPGMGGFQLLDLHDFPGQGTALVGVLDPFWDSKPYVTPAEYHRFACETVPLARLPKRVWTTAESLSAQVELAHFGPADLTQPEITWRLAEGAGQPVASGSWNPKTIATGKLSTLGELSIPLAQVAAPVKLTLSVEVAGTEYVNDWEVWVYPPRVDVSFPKNVSVAHTLDAQAVEHLAAGGTVLLLPSRGSVKGDQLGKIPAGFSSIFWNTAWTRRQPPHTLGILCDPRHPALAVFPTDYHSDWQWWELVTRGQAMILNDLPAKLRPIVSIVDDWVTNRRLGLVFEAAVGGGRLLVSSIDLESDLDQRPAARQLRHSLSEYLRRDDLQPAVQVELAAIRDLFQAPTFLQRVGATVRGSSAAAGHEADRAIDGDVTTIWHTPWGDDAPPFPHELVIDLHKPTNIAGLRYVPRQEQSNGWITQYEVYVSDDGRAWVATVARGTWQAGSDPRISRFSQPERARFVRFVATAGYEGKPFASIAELEVLPAELEGPQP